MDEQLKLGWKGFEQAEQQLLEEIQTNGNPLVPLANLMQWAYSIDQWHRNGIADGENEPIQLFGADTVGETVDPDPAIPSSNKGLPSYKKYLAGKSISDRLPAVREFLEVRLPNLLAQKPKP